MFLLSYLCSSLRGACLTWIDASLVQAVSPTAACTIRRCPAHSNLRHEPLLIAETPCIKCCSDWGPSAQHLYKPTLHWEIVVLGCVNEFHYNPTSLLYLEYLCAAVIVIFMQIPNPLFDLAGITCGHFLVPFWTFFGATLIGKAIIKMHIQVCKALMIALSFH